MHLFVNHTTRYTFSEPVRFVVQSLKLTPAHSGCQSPLRWLVSADGCHISQPFIDGYGDAIHTLTFPGEVAILEIKVEGEIETKDTAGVLRHHRERVRPEIFLRQSPMTKPDREIAMLAKDIAAAHARPSDRNARLNLAHALSTRISDEIAYKPGVTHAHTTAAEALAAGEGVCQDHAHVLISAARLLGIPARYVSGYLCTDSDGTAAEASHGWAELHLDGVGWVGFDASNRTCPTENYIRLGSGVDARDAAPIRGVHAGAAEEDLDVSVVVQQAQQ